MCISTDYIITYHWKSVIFKLYLSFRKVKKNIIDLEKFIKKKGVSKGKNRSIEKSDFDQSASFQFSKKTRYNPLLSSSRSLILTMEFDFDRPLQLPNILK